MSRGARVIVGSLLLILVLLIVYVSSVVRSVDDGIELGRMQEEIKWYKRENMLLQEEVLERQALGTIKHEAEKQGFVPGPTVIIPSRKK